jgi:molybdate transport system regulatory protein
MRLSIRNQLPGTVVSVASGGAMSTVKVRLAGGQEITSAITAESARDLGLAEGVAVRALVKSTEVSVATGLVNDMSIRNRMSGVVSSIDHGTVMSTVKIALPSGELLTAAITRDAADDLKLGSGSEVTALVKSTEVSLAVD